MPVSKKEQTELHIDRLKQGRLTLRMVGTTPMYFNKQKSIKCSSNKNKQGRIYCVCAFQCYENGMLLCSKCANYSHAECYNVVDINMQTVAG